MGRQHEQPESRRSTRAALVYLPCPVCGSAVLLSDETLVADEPPTYECPTCRAVFELR